MMYALTGVVYFAAYLPAWLCFDSPLLGMALGVTASVAWMTLADRRYDHPWLWWTGRRINGKRWG